MSCRLPCRVGSCRFFVLLIFTLYGSQASAADAIWDNVPGGNWENNLNWSTGFTPGNFDTATFNLAQSYTVVFGANPAAIQALFFNAGTVTFQSSGGTRTLGISALGGSNRVFVLGDSTLILGAVSSNPVNLYIPNGLFVENSATLTARSASNVNVLGSLDVGTIVDGNIDPGTATYNIQGAATMQLGGNLAIASDNVAGVNGVVNITGTDSALIQYDNVAVANVTVGSISGGTGSIAISSNGAMTTGTGLTTINKTGRISTTNSTGRLNVNGDIFIDGGLLSTAGTFNWATGRTMDVINGGDLTFSTAYSTPNNSVINVSGFESRIVTTGTSSSFTIIGGAEVNVNAQATMITGGILSVGTGKGAGSGKLVVDGLGTELVSPASAFAATGNLADVTFSNQAVGSFTGGMTLAGSTTAGTTAFLSVESGADLVNVGNLNLATSGGATTSATMTITDAGSSIAMAASRTLTIGHATLGVATLNVNDGGSLVVGASGTTVLNATGKINIDGGSVDLKTLTQNGGKINFHSGSLTYVGNLTVGAGGLLGTNLSLTGEHILALTGTATVNSGSLLLIESGAAFTATTLANNGQVILSGLDAVANPTTTNNAGLIRGEGRIVGTFNNNAAGELRTEDGKRIAIQGANGTNAGRVNLLGGTAQFSNALTNGTGGTIIGRGTLIVGGAGLTNNGNLALSNGTSSVFGDLNNATGVATRGVTVSGNSNVTFWDDVTNGAGSLFKVTTGSSATFFGTYSGAGITGGGSVYFEADISPGFSPAAISFQNDVALGTTAKLNIELGGLTAGSQFDQVSVTGLLSLGGTLNVMFINGFNAAAGNSFDILNWGSLTGTFAALQLPTLSGGLSWNTNQLYNTGVLSVTSVVAIPGDFDGDGDVDGADFVAWQTHFPTASGATLADGDADGDGDVDGADFVVWQTNFPFTPAPATSPVPEPATWLMALAAIIPFLLRRTAQRAARQFQCGFAPE